MFDEQNVWVSQSVSKTWEAASTRLFVREQLPPKVTLPHREMAVHDNKTRTRRRIRRDMLFEELRKGWQTNYIDPNT